MTYTSSFGTSKRESHDSSNFYARNLYSQHPQNDVEKEPNIRPTISVEDRDLNEWVDRTYQKSAVKMNDIPDNSVGLAFTSPPYNVGKDYDDDMALSEYLNLIRDVGNEVYRVLVPGGRYLINIANLGRKPYIPLHSWFYEIHSQQLQFLPMGEIIWQKAKGASGSCAWGSWKSAKAPRLRDIHEYILVFAKEDYSRPDKGESTIQRDDFMAATLSIWNIPPESAKRIGHPAPFPVELAQRCIELYSYRNDVVLDPFLGSGTTSVAAKQLCRHYVGYDISEEYCMLAKSRLSKTPVGSLLDSRVSLFDEQC